MLPCQCWSVFTQQWNILTSAGKHILIKMWPITRALRLITRFPPAKGHNVLIIQFMFIELILILSAGIPCFCYSQPATQWASNFNTLKRMSWVFYEAVSVLIMKVKMMSVDTGQQSFSVCKVQSVQKCFKPAFFLMASRRQRLWLQE